MYGREARLPIDITLSKPGEEEDTTQELTLDEKLEKMIELQKQIHDQARDNVLKAQEKQKQQYDAKHNGRTELKVRASIMLADDNRLSLSHFITG